MTMGDFVRQKKHLFWSTKNYDGLSAAAVVEGVLNYGDMDDVRELITLIGKKQVAKTFLEHTKKNTRTNYRPEVINYFSLYFKQHA